MQLIIDFLLIWQIGKLEMIDGNITTINARIK